ncbi:methylenetetrahydrofolate reductase [NAD(P)H] [Elongatibacter sediminis]|uniref:Methylenetetrahydrofolate reductase n=1 Tax=Elongatibacter sediminis TaxID=3119006 RepID=A0AAW9RB06_9GAMM
MSAPPVSFEFFPPRSAEQKLVLESTWQKLSPLRPAYLSVTFGAGGSTLDSTRETVNALLGESGVPVAPHISCMVRSESQIRDLLQRYREDGVERLVVLRGDRPEGMTGPGPFQYANELVRWIRREFGAAFHIEVACYPEFHPESPSPQEEMKFFRAKVDAGADGAITQYFYNADSYFRLLDDCARAGIDIPVTPGIMPITNYRQLSRFSDMCGAEIPRWIRRRLEGFGDDGASIRAFGLDVVSGLCERLLAGGAPGLHIYTLNRANASLLLWQRLAGEAAGKPAPVR